MAIVQPIAGAYTSTYNGDALGYTRSGYNLNFTHKAERIEETDIYGLSLIDLIYRGAQMTIDFICKLFAAARTSEIFWPWATTWGDTYTAARPIAQLASSEGGALVLTSVANTSAATNPATLTADPVIFSPDQSMQIILNSTLREAPIKLDVLTSDVAGTGVLFAVS